MYTSHTEIMIREKIINQIIKKEIRVSQAAEILSVSRQTISKWKARYIFDGISGITPVKSGPKQGFTPKNKTSSELEKLVCETAQNNNFQGPRWISDFIYEFYETEIHQSTVYRILKRNEVRYFRNYKNKKRKRKSYVLESPGREIQLDVCFPFGYERKAVIFDAIDDHSRFISAEVKNGKNINNSISFMKNLLSRVPFDIQAVRTDQGTEFGKKFTEFLNKNGIKHRRNPPYTPQHNGKIERFHRTLKEMEVYFWDFSASVDELSYRLNRFVYFYNFHRKHYGLGMNGLTPVQKLCEFYLGFPLRFAGRKNVNLLLQQYKTCFCDSLIQNGDE